MQCERLFQDVATWFGTDDGDSGLLIIKKLSQFILELFGLIEASIDLRQSTLLDGSLTSLDSKR